MTTETSQVKSRLATLAESVDDLEELLGPLLAQSLPETIMSLEPMQQAKLQTVLPYLVYDLLFIYLKIRGVDPKSHPVIQELDRVKHYFQKIANAESSGSKEPATKLDKAAAGRFIKNAIAQATRQPTQIEPPPPPATASSSIPIKVTSKMQVRAEYELNLMQQDDQTTDEEDLEVTDKTGTAGNDVDNDKPLGKSAHLDKDADKTETQVGKKRRRSLVDPFAGYGGDDSSRTDRGAQSQSESYSVPKPMDASYQTPVSSTAPSIDATSSSHRSLVNPQNKKKMKAKHQAV